MAESDVDFQKKAYKYSEGKNLFVKKQKRSKIQYLFLCLSMKCIDTVPLYRTDLKEQHKVYLYIGDILIHQNVLK